MFVVAMGLLDASGRAAVALMARRTAKFVRIMRLQKFRFGMTRKCPGVLVRFFPRWRHSRCSQFYRLANFQVAGLGTGPEVFFRFISFDSVRLPNLHTIFFICEPGMVQC